MNTKFRVRLKTSSKLKILGGLLVISILIVLIVFPFFDVDVKDGTYTHFFIAEVINPYKIERTSVTTKIKNDSRFPHTAKYPYEVRVRAHGEDFIVGSFKQSFVTEKICIGVLSSVKTRKVANYVRVDEQNCK
ncbi:hypothetical protein ISG33_14490 [Glaciecola sp. MH2013]|uniref:hypothetical protein n=1 Tax=Glaciecola sp. MH2013 TaxID=2785524 RepID=UPI00189E8AA6|nr:hypothetical protein [Glaciecola sp. MH2013]MBF7074611.1 hypothetical protein [Glaciecola sp. MH2013]